MAPDSTLMMRITLSANKLRYLWCALVVSLFLIAIVSASAHAQGTPATPTNVYTLNGVLVKFVDARANLLALKYRVQPYLSDEENLVTDFFFIYNDTQGFDDLLEVLLASLGLGVGRFWEWLAGLEPFPDAVEGFFHRLAQYSIWVANALDQNTINRVMDTARDAIKACKRVVVVAHSQGNLYLNSAVANDAFLTATQRKSFGTVNVAVPDDRVQMNVTEFTTIKYTTVDLDLIIHPLVTLARTLVLQPPPLPANTNDGYVNPFARALNHSFTASYMAFDESRSRIVQDTLQTMRSLSLSSCIEIKTASCWQFDRPPPGLPFNISSEGTARSEVDGAFIKVTEATFSSPGEIEFQETHCDRWTGTYPPYVPPPFKNPFCQRQAGDPFATSFDTFGNRWWDAPPITSLSVELRLPSPGSPKGFDTLAEAKVPLTCPGYYVSPNNK
jgi:hypothetical protein